jgi:hypothetical protein
MRKDSFHPIVSLALVALALLAAGIFSAPVLITAFLPTKAWAGWTSAAIASPILCIWGIKKLTHRWPKDLLAVSILSLFPLYVATKQLPGKELCSLLCWGGLFWEYFRLYTAMLKKRTGIFY